MDKNIRPHDRLKGILRMHRITLDDLAEMTNLKKYALSHRFSKQQPWDLDTILTICDLCSIAYSDIPNYFERSKKK